MVWSPFVRLAGGRYELWFVVPGRGLHVATSRNGLAFTIGRKAVLGVDSNELAGPPVEGGPRGLPRDASVVPVAGGERLLYWLAGRGTFSAFRATR
jgi:hypothetical protein